MHVLNAGGGDQIAYDPRQQSLLPCGEPVDEQRQVVRTRLHRGVAVCTPVLVTIDAGGTRTVLSMRPTGNNAHSVAVDPATHSVYMPFSSATAPAGCDPAPATASRMAGFSFSNNSERCYPRCMRWRRSHGAIASPTPTSVHRASPSSAL